MRHQGPARTASPKLLPPITSLLFCCASSSGPAQTALDIIHSMFQVLLTGRTLRAIPVIQDIADREGHIIIHLYSPPKVAVEEECRHYNSRYSSQDCYLSQPVWQCLLFTCSPVLIQFPALLFQCPFWLIYAFFTLPINASLLHPTASRAEMISSSDKWDA